VTSPELTTAEFTAAVKALTSFSAESVNRIKLRESGALKVFVKLLASDSSHHKAVHDHIVNALPRFGYDALSLKTLGDEGVISCLTKILNDYNSDHRHHHDCDREDATTTTADTSGTGESIETGDRSIPSSPSAMGSASPSSVCSGLSDAEMLDLTSLSDDGGEGGGVSRAAAAATESADPAGTPENPISTLANLSATPTATPSKENTSRIEILSRDSYGRMIDSALQFFLRVFEIQLPSEELTSAENVKAIVRYICWTKNPSHRAGLILIRISKSMKYIKPFLLQGLFPWLRLEVGERLYGCNELTCPTCQNIKSTFTSIFQEFVFAAETGYIEGTVCHALVKGNEETRIVMTVGIVAIVMCKTLLFNILITHGGLEVMLEALETLGPFSEEMFSHTVLSLRLLAERVNVVSAIDIQAAPLKREDGSNRCFYAGTQSAFDVKLVTDDGTRIGANRRVLSEANSVFGAMLEGNFFESTADEVEFSCANSKSVVLLIHHLYGCRGCKALSDTSDLDAWLELIPMTDKYLVEDFNRDIFRTFMRILTGAAGSEGETGKVIDAYQKSLNIVCPTTGQEAESLSTSIVTFLLVGEIHHPVRVRLYRELAQNHQIKQDFLVEISNIITSRLKAEMQKPRRHLFKSH